MKVQIKEVITMARGFYNGIGFAYEGKRYTVCAWDDTDEVWICKNTFGNYRYFTNDQLEAILFKIIQNYLDSTIQM